MYNAMTSFLPKRINLCFNPLERKTTFKRNEAKVQVVHSFFLFEWFAENASKKTTVETAKEKKIIIKAEIKLFLREKSP